MNILENLLNGSDVTYNQKCVPLLLLSGQEIEAKLNQISGKYGLTYLQTMILHFLEEGERDSMTINELSECLSYKANTSRSVGQLVKMDLVSKNRSVTDERVVHVSITEKGIKLKKTIEKSLEPLYTVGLDEKEAESLYELLFKVMTYQASRDS